MAKTKRPVVMRVCEHCGAVRYLLNHTHSDKCRRCNKMMQVARIQVTKKCVRCEDVHIQMVQSVDQLMDCCYVCLSSLEDVLPPCRLGCPL
jgi:hypothetical protein